MKKLSKSKPAAPSRSAFSGNSVWISWWSPANGIATFKTSGSEFDTLLAVYTGDTVGDLSKIKDDDDSGGFHTSQLSFNARAGTLYHIAVAMLLVVALAVIVAMLWSRRRGAEPPVVGQPVEVRLSDLTRKEGRLYQADDTNAFTGMMVEAYADGVLKSRSSVSNGLLHGVSQGWYTNGQLQVTEPFREGVSEGVRTKWYDTGAKLSEATVVAGELHGPFRKWHENGVLAERLEMVHGQPEGGSVAYYPSGFLKARVTMKEGKPVEQKFWKDGEMKEEAVTGNTQ